MIGVVFDRDRFIVYAGAIDDDSSLPRHQIKQMREMWQVGKIRCLVDHKNCDVERLDIARMWDIWQIIARLAEHRHFVPEALAELDIFGDGPHRADPALQPRYKQDLHKDPRR